MAPPRKTSLWKALPQLLLVLAFVLAPVFGEGGTTGDNGIVNLPSCARGAGKGGPPPHALARMRMNVGPVCAGLTFRLPSGMDQAVASLGVVGQPGVPILVTDGLIVLTGAQLDELRQGGAESLLLDIAGVDCFLHVRITFVPATDEAIIEVW